MNKLLHILSLALILLMIGTSVQAQDSDDLPWACAGTTQSYWVKGFNGTSMFQWKVEFHPRAKTTIDVTDDVIKEYSLNGDTVVIEWPVGPEWDGFYSFSVIETTAYGCIGVEWVQDIIVNSSSYTLDFENVPSSFFACEGQVAVLDPGAKFINYLWQDGSTNQTFLTNEAGTYEVRLVNPLQSCAFAKIDAGFHPLPDIDLGPPDTTLFGTQTLLLDADIPGVMSWSWFAYNFNENKWGNQPFGVNPTHTVQGGSGDQWIAVWVTDNNGCVNSDSIYVRAADYSKFRIPSAFIPESEIGENRIWNFPAPLEDGGSDLFPYLTDVEVRVFNRWGSMVWESNGMYQPWDGRDMSGKPLPMDSYHYIIRIKVNGQVFLYKGSVTIIR